MISFQMDLHVTKNIISIATLFKTSEINAQAEKPVSCF